MKQTGRVVSVSSQKTVISVIRETACGESCASCTAKCSLKDAQVLAETVPGLEEGDTVIFEMAASKVLFAAFLVYITPLLVLLAFFGVAVFVGMSEEMGALVGIAAMVLWFMIVHFIDKRLKKYYKHTIIQKVTGDV